jgi:predicted ATPase
MKQKTPKKRAKRNMHDIPPVLHDVRDSFLDVLKIGRDAFDGARLAVVTGENAAGKSFLRRIIAYFAKEHKVEVMHLSQEGRTEAGIHRAFIYGDEGDRSTGDITCRTFITGFKSSRGRENDHTLIWDEPEIGLGEEAQAGAAQYMVEQLADWPKKLRGLVVMTHSRIFVETLMRVEGARFVNVGGKYATADQWLSRKVVPQTPEYVQQTAHNNFRAFLDLMNKSEKEDQ